MAGKIKRKTGRPKIELDPVQAEKLAMVGCTDEEIATILGTSQDTVQRRKKDDPVFCAALENGRANRKMSLRRKQTEVAMTGNVGMLIWLGKQELGQRDHHDHDITGRQELRVHFEEQAKREVESLYGRLEAALARKDQQAKPD